ncbi:TPA: hypothetical protein ACMU79_002521 [Clostridioides difficile]|nr:hypothetical protein [Clostridioides difficile]MCW0565259.1 hypothetical protein [Clostridioides difficile]MCW0636879.1 hypothetical protein [Clostridioides difficile]MCW0803710.1 hypothetical protein [Clostridioides difficile]MCZ8461358.1 hypothetical protein [Clostridioides difficile]MDB9636144.1 hypothetical protein [Clostridioides difficile]
MKKDEYLKKNKSKLEKILKAEPKKYEYIIKLIEEEMSKKNKRV